MPQIVAQTADKNPAGILVNLPRQVVVQIVSNILAESVEYATDKHVAAAVNSTIGVLLTGEHPGNTVTLPFDVAFFLRVGSHLLEDDTPGDHPGVIAEKALAQALIAVDEAQFDAMYIDFHFCTKPCCTS